MATNAEKALALFKQEEGKEEGVGEWMQVTQARINAFADDTEDHQFIHVDPEKAAQLSPWKVTIAHGFLTLSLLTHLDASIPKDAKKYEGVVMGINYGFDKVRFVNPVKVDARIRARSELMEADLKDPSTLQIKRKMTIEIEGETKPACIAEWLARVVYA